jgi:hypothetical protein
LITIAEKPNVMIRSLKIGTALSLSPGPFMGLFISSHLKKTNNTKAMLQINVNFDKNLNKRIAVTTYNIKAIF